MPYPGIPEGSETEKKLERCVQSIMEKNPTWDKSRAIATCRASMKKEVDMVADEVLKQVDSGMSLDELYDEKQDEEDGELKVPDNLKEIGDEPPLVVEEEKDTEIEIDLPDESDDVVEEKETTEDFVMDVLGMEEKETEGFDFDVASIETLLAIEDGFSEKIQNYFAKATLTSSARASLKDSDFALIKTEKDGSKIRKYPIHDKPHVRNALAKAAQMIKSGGEAAADAREALPKIKAAAKRHGIGGPSEKNRSAIIVEKDADGGYRFVGWLSGRWKDRDGDIITDEAHKEFSQFLLENNDFPIVFRSWHEKGTDRKYPIDLWAYKNGFVIVSGKLTEHEAVRLMKATQKRKIGMSHGFFAKRDIKNPHEIIKYRTFEVSDLPQTHASFPWSDITQIMEAKSMNTKLEYLKEVLSEEQLKKLTADAESKEILLDELGVDTKEFDAWMNGEEVEEEKETSETEEVVAELDPEVKSMLQKELNIENIDELLESAKQIDVLKPLFGVLMKKVDALSEKLEERQETVDEKLAKSLSPKYGEKRSVLAKAASVSDDNTASEDEIKEMKPEHKNNWLADVFNVEPISVGGGE